MTRPLRAAHRAAPAHRVPDFPAWQEVRRRNDDWLTQWEPARMPGAPDVVEDRDAFAARCSARQRERQLGTGYGFGIFVDGEFAGEINLIVGPAGPVPDRLRRLLDRREARRQRLHARGGGGRRRASRFEELHLHRLQIAIIPRNRPAAGWSRSSGSATRASPMRYLEINGVWEDHVRYAITAEEWDDAATTSSASIAGRLDRLQLDVCHRCSGDARQRLVISPGARPGARRTPAG